MAAVYFLYFFQLTATGLIGPDEPRYASIGREMARSGDWVTPRLWGHPWFEKPALLYWMTGAAFRLGLGDDLAPRLPVAALGALFLPFYYWALRHEFGRTAAAYATLILGGSAGWLALSFASVTDTPLSVFFSAAMLLGMRWFATDEPGWLTLAGASLGAAVLAKGPLPVALAIPFAWFARAKLRAMLRWQPVAAFVAVAAPWYWLCYLKNGAEFPRVFLLEHNLGRFFSPALQHEQPIWFYLPVILAAVFPWTPTIALLFRRSLYSESRRKFLLLWVCFGLVLLSLSVNKLHGYILPLLPAIAALMGIALAETRRAHVVLSISAALLCLVFPIAAVLPRALDVGLSRADPTVWRFWWAAPVALAAAVWYLELRRRTAAVALVATGLTVAVIYLKLAAFPAIEANASARSLWRKVAADRDRVCVYEIHRNWRYGLNYYSVDPLPDCTQNPRPLRISQKESIPDVSPYMR